MTVLRRTLYLNDGPSFESICSDMEEVFSSGERQLLWPHSEYLSDNLDRVSDLWESGVSSQHQLARIQWTLRNEGTTTLHFLTIGSNTSNQLVLHEEISLIPFQLQIPYTELATLAPLLEGYLWLNEDGYWANHPFCVEPHNVARFAEFVQRPVTVRSLPIVLLSVDPHRQPFSNNFLGLLRWHLIGLAYVTELQPEAEHVLRALLPEHSCYGGALRVYLPGYSRNDPSALHPFWTLRQMYTKGEHTVFNEVVGYVAKHMLPHLSYPDTINALEKEKAEESVRERVLAQIELGRQQIKQRDDAQIEETWDALVKEYDGVRQQLDELNRENLDLRHKVKVLQWQFNQKSADSLPFSSHDEKQVVLQLSDRAKEVYGTFDLGEQRFWSENLFPKLLNEQLREGQSEAFHCNGDTYRVYPRDRSASGRRIIYILQDTDVRVYVIFRNHDDYEEFRTKGIEKSDFSDFERWAP